MAVADGFRDGNVPARKGPLPVGEYCFRGDSACAEEKLLKWLGNQQWEDGPSGFIAFAVSARMNLVLREAIRATPEEWWQPHALRTSAWPTLIAAANRCAVWQYGSATSWANCSATPPR